MKTFDRGFAAGLVEREENSCSLRRTKEEQRKRGEVFLCLKERERERERERVPSLIEGKGKSDLFCLGDRKEKGEVAIFGMQPEAPLFFGVST